ncbi:MAG: amino acid ABC transporter substrate-binding protein [Sphingopyxis macrogoltabida]|uniref:Amino acid ABC transporter substrate-binding protein n=1 Tax=Sphingopyxis macrogoltabida TaxID=33050 RepID=A0A2W5L5F6_SPHMC|nr:MAG: amino acid ABC transporter substrate-binding protein [Sphingopyxis macrogoltabida]
MDRRSIIGMVAALPVIASPLAGCTRAPRSPNHIIVGSSPTGAPYSFVDPATNELTGAMIDIARAVMREAGFESEYHVAPFSALIPSLTTGRIDMISAAMQRTPDREKIVDFSAPVSSYGGGLVVRDDDRAAYPSLASVRHLRMGAQVGTRFFNQLREAGIPDISTYDGLAEIVRDLANGRIDAGYGDEPILRYLLRVGPKRPVRMADDFQPPVHEDLCLIVGKGDPRLPRIDAAVARLKPAAIPAILERWALA